MPDLPNVRMGIDGLLVVWFRTWKHHMHCNFKLFRGYVEEARLQPCSNVSQENWHVICDTFMSEEFQVRNSLSFILYILGT